MTDSHARILIREFAAEATADGHYFSAYDDTSYGRACDLLKAEAKRCREFALALYAHKSCASLFLEEARCLTRQ